jgi:hypothetical protein
MPDAWYYVVENDRQAGPVSFEILRTFLLSPQGGRNALVWRNGFQDWRTAGEVAELVSIFSSPPPIPRLPVAPASQTASFEPIAPEAAPESTVPKPAAQGTAVGKVFRTGAPLIGAVIGITIAQAFGSSLLWPIGLTALAWFILTKSKVEQPAIPMMAVLFGHTSWMLIGHGALYLMGRLTDDQLWFLVDIVVVIALAVWYFVSRSRTSAVGILVYQIAALVFGLAEIGNVTLPNMSSRALVVAQLMHIALRVFGIGAAIYAIVKLGKRLRLVSVAQV